MRQQKLPPICVTGIGCVSAAGIGVDGLLQNKTVLCEAGHLHKDAMPYPYFAVPQYVFREKRYFSARDTLDLALAATEQAVAQSKLFVDGHNTKSCAVVLGTTAGSALHFLEGYAAQRGEKQSFTMPQDIYDYFHSNISLGIAQKYRLHGPALTIANACTSGADAIGMAMDMLLQGQCNAALCGGADALSLVPHTGFARLMIYSKEQCRPFDAHRQGLNLGEGAGIIVLEKTEYALARGATPLGYVVGYGACADAHHFTAPHPEARGLHTAIQIALEQADIHKEQLAFINAHGTATTENDKVEGHYFVKHLNAIPVWGSKSRTGHTLGAAGAIEAILCLLALQQRRVPATEGFHDVDPHIGLIPTQETLVIEKDYALSTSLGFGGSNAALILQGEAV